MIKIFRALPLHILFFVLITINFAVANDSNPNYSTNNKDEAIKKSLNIVKNATKKMLDEAAGNSTLFKRIEFELDVSSEGKPIYDILIVQPLYISKDSKHTFFTQGRIAYGNDDKTTSNIGFGYRNLIMNERLMWGLNSFHDREWSFGHQRVGFGAEVRSSALQFNSNYYNATTSWKTDNNNVSFEERAMDGYDFEIGSQLPYLPWAYIFAKKYYWQSNISNNNDIDGETFSARLRPLRFLEVELGTSDDSVNGNVSFAEIRLRVNWGTENYSKNKIFLAEIDNKAFRFNESMKDQTLSKVRRENDIRVERRLKGASVTVSVSRGN